MHGLVASALAGLLPRWDAPAPDASQPLGGFGRLPRDFAVAVAVGDNTSWRDGGLGAYHHNAMFDYLEGSFVLYWKNSPLVEDDSGQRVLGSVSSDGEAWARPVVVFPNLTSGGPRELI